MTVHFNDPVPSIDWNADDPVWFVKQAKRKTLHILCRPLLKSVALTIREINGFRDRPNEDYIGKDHPNDEDFAVLTCNNKHEQVMLSQGIGYVYLSERNLILRNEGFRVAGVVDQES